MKLNPLAMMREEFDGTGVVFDPNSHKAMTLNASGVAVWKVLDAGGTAADAVARLVEEFLKVTPEQAADDVRKFIDVLKEKSLLSEE